jgi:hypothetical protein
MVKRAGAPSGKDCMTVTRWPTYYLVLGIRN